MKVIIHIGIEKTGTTTIQEFLHLNRDNLAKQGVAYLRSPGIKNNQKLATYCMNNHRIDDQVKSLGIISDTKRKEWKANFKQKFEKEIKNLDKKISSVIISSEQFHSRLATEDEVRNLLTLLNPHFTDITILVYLRRQDRVAVSHYSTKVKGGVAMSNIFPTNFTAQHPYYNYYNLIERWISVFGKENIHIRIFDKNKFVDGNLLQDFICGTKLSIKFDNLIIPEKQNEKLSASVQNAVLLMNPFFPRYKRGTPIGINLALRKYVINQLQKKHKGKEKLPTRKEALDFYTQFADSNQKLANKYLSSKILFDNDFSIYPEVISQEPLKEDIFRDILDSISIFLSNSFIVSKKRLDSINIKDNPEVILKKLAVLYDSDFPQISLFLMKEARKYEPNAPEISKKIESLNQTLSTQKTNK